MLLIHAVAQSRDSKTGPIPVTYQKKENTCPKSCPLMEAGCYARLGNVGMLWNKLNKAAEETKTYLTWDRFMHWVKALPSRQAWRYAVAGDLPHTGDEETVDAEKLAQLVKANASGKKKGFTYTHHSPFIAGNAEAIQAANKGGFTVNLSADGLDEADKLADLGIAPVVTIMPKTERGHCTTPKGRKVVECLASNPRVPVKNCVECQFLCQKVDRDFIVGFTPHGSAKAAAQKVMEAN